MLGANELREKCKTVEVPDQTALTLEVGSLNEGAQRLENSFLDLGILFTVDFLNEI